MNKFQTIFDEIHDFPESGRSNLIGSLRKKLDNADAGSRKSLIGCSFLIIGYLLFEGALINDVNLGPFKINDINTLIYFLPLVSAFLLSNFSSNFYTSAYLNYLIYCLEIKHFDLKKESELHLASLNNTEAKRGEEFKKYKSNKLTNKSGKKGCFQSCLMILPLSIIALAAFIFIPLLYYFIVSFTINNIELTFFGIKFLDWTPFTFTITFIILSLNSWVKVYKFYSFKNKHNPWLDPKEN
ncbi:hypothetical protein MWU58_00650 [Flavobacteriaceae bacterium S0825]|uniref:hypothetical protein n=1 Tax=Gaetbulibacter sp. S0825 TaxID=2720084 RepID=UPI001431A7E6|nr:hypothetical protein [Gaetbulibacter sp. S0825]MCK0107789.1 hypothetical protein [Flavobacteriaceae bacterium S0825]NIX63425.1 hypothetical protein [Gaetbulibacter sp. S0825]